jgi:hypothetical protein
MYIVGKYYQGNPDKKPEQWGSIADVQYAVRHWCEEWLGVDYPKLIFAVPGWQGTDKKIIDLGYKSNGFGTQLVKGTFDKKYGINLINPSYAYLNSTLHNNDGEEFSLFFDFIKRGSSTSQAILAGYDNQISYGYVAVYPNTKARIRFADLADFTNIKVFDKRNQLVFVCDKNKNVKAYQNALLKQTIYVLNTEFDFNQIGSPSGPYSIDDATIYNSFGFKTALNTQHVELLSNQPSNLFQPVSRPIYFDFTDLPEPSVFSLDMSWKIKNISSKNSSYKIYGENDKSLAWKLLNEQSKDLSWLIFDLSEKETAWKVLNLKEQDTGYKIFNEQTKNTTFKIRNETTKQTQYKILNQAQKELAWKILSSGVLSQDISWKILNDISKQSSYKIFNKIEKDISWQILGINQASVNLAWKIITQIEQVVEWKIKDENSSDLAWKILNELSLDTSFKIFEIKSHDLAYKIFNEIEKDISWKIISGVETKTIDFTATKRILDFNSEQKIYAFNSKTRTLIFYQKERK